MPEAKSAREEIIVRLRAFTLQDAEFQSAAEWNAIPRSFRKAGTLNLDERLQLFEERLRDYGAGVHHAAENDLARQIANVLRARGKRSMLLPPEFPQDWMPEGIDFVRDEQLSNEVLDQSEGVITGCTLCIALTGTIVLQSGPLEGRRALTLIPDYHLCLARAEQVVELVPEAMRKLSAAGNKPTTLISGPSATADIEMTRIQGVHGPRLLDVVIVH